MKTWVACYEVATKFQAQQLPKTHADGPGYVWNLEIMD